MKHKTLLFTIVVFFILINTTHFWEERLGWLAMPAAVSLFIFYIFLLFVLLQQLYLLLKEKFRDIHRIIATAFLLTVILFTYFKPRGIINFEKTRQKELLVAQTKSNTACNTLLRFLADGNFIERNDCFGITEVKGKYELKGDTIYFTEVEMDGFENKFYRFAVLTRGDVQKPGGTTLTKFYNEMDKKGQSLVVIKNTLRP